MIFLGKKNSAYNAAIDSVTSGFINGWVFNPDKINGEQSFYISVNDEIVTVCTAELYREDLKQAGLGNGKHGFSFPIYKFLKKDQRSTVVLLDAAQRNINGARVEIEAAETFCTAEIIKCENYQLFYSLRRENITPVIVNIYDNDTLIFREKIENNYSIENLVVALPPESIDGAEHVFVLGVENEYFPLSVEKIYIPLLYAPENSRVQNDIAKLHRYKSVQSRLKNIQSFECMDSLSNTVDCLEAEPKELKTKFSLDIPYVEAPKLSIIVLDDREVSDCFHLTASLLLASNNTDFELLFECDKNTRKYEILNQKITNVRLVESSKSSSGIPLKQLVKLANGEFIMIANQVDEFTSFYVDHVIEKFKDDLVGVVGGKLIDINGRIKDAGTMVNSGDDRGNKLGYFSDPSFCVTREVDLFTASAITLKRSLLIDLLDGVDDYLAESEITALICRKAKDSSLKVEYLPAAESYNLFPKSLISAVEELSYIEKDTTLAKLSGPTKAIMVIDFTTPTPDQDAGSYAAIQEIRVFIALGFRVVFVAENLLYKNKYTEELQNLGVEVLYYPFYKTIQDVLTINLPNVDAVYISRYHVAENYIHLIKSRYPTLPIIFNNADLHFLREIRAGISSNCVTTLRNSLATRYKELSVIGKADAVLSYSRVEHAVIASHLMRSEHIFLTPWVLSEKPKGKKFSERQGIAFLGGYKHAPNIEAVEYFVDQVLPLLMKLAPHIKFYVYGSNMPESIKRLTVDNLEVVGYARSLDDVYNNHKIFVVPLLSGAGIKGKVLEAMAYGVPSVLSPVAAEETGLVHNINSFIADNAENWAKSIVSLYNDEALWRQFSDSSRRIANEEFSFEKACKKMKVVFDYLGVRN